MVLHFPTGSNQYFPRGWEKAIGRRKLFNWEKKLIPAVS